MALVTVGKEPIGTTGRYGFRMRDESDEDDGVVDDRFNRCWRDGKETELLTE